MQGGLGVFRVMNKPHLPQINPYPNGLHFSITDAEAVDNHLSKGRNKMVRLIQDGSVSQQISKHDNKKAEDCKIGFPSAKTRRKQ